MNLAGAVASFVVIFLLMIGGTMWLRFRGALTPAHGRVVSAVITEGVLPAMIFCYVARAAEQTAFAELAMVIALAECMALGISALLGRFLMGLDRRSLGSFVLAASFGSTSLIGNALLDVVFHGSAAVLGMGMVIGQFGVGVPNNTLGLWVGMRAGLDVNATPATRYSRDRLAFLKTPVVIAVLAGIAWSWVGIPTTLPGISSLFGALTLTGAALPFLAAAVTGLSLTHTDWRRLMPLIGVSQVLQLIAKPLFVLAIISALPVPNIDREVTLLLAALPASPLAAAFASRFGGDTELASALVVSSTLLSVVTLPLIAWIA
jgi:malate permease and related proteins